MRSMNNEPLHDAIIARIIDLYEGGNDPVDICDHLDGRLSLDEIKSTLSDYEQPLFFDHFDTLLASMEITRK
tara:strand:- start:2312 stop:2527 length:216 start_codon:yes stop_codon:yes gene_type:complete